MKIRGKIWKFGNNIDTDAIIPARYLNTSDPKELAKHVMEDADKDFPTKVKHGDIIIAGRNFGCGSSREHAPLAIKAAGYRQLLQKVLQGYFSEMPSISGFQFLRLKTFPMKPMKEMK